MSKYIFKCPPSQKTCTGSEGVKDRCWEADTELGDGASAAWKNESSCSDDDEAEGWATQSNKLLCDEGATGKVITITEVAPCVLRRMLCLLAGLSVAQVTATTCMVTETICMLPHLKSSTSTHAGLMCASCKPLYVQDSGKCVSCDGEGQFNRM